jgi:hypothetical protein
VITGRYYPLTSGFIKFESNVLEFAEPISRQASRYTGAMAADQLKPFHLCEAQTQGTWAGNQVKIF